MIILRLHLATFSITPIHLRNLSEEFYASQIWYDPKESGVICIAFKDIHNFKGEDLSTGFKCALISFLSNNQMKIKVLWPGVKRPQIGDWYYSLDGTCFPVESNSGWIDMEIKMSPAFVERYVMNRPGICFFYRIISQ